MNAFHQIILPHSTTTELAHPTLYYMRTHTLDHARVHAFICTNTHTHVHAPDSYRGSSGFPTLGGGTALDAAHVLLATLSRGDRP